MATATRRRNRGSEPAAAASATPAKGKTASVRPVAPTKARYSFTAIATYAHEPTNRHDQAEPFRTFVLCQNGFATEVHTGPGFTLDHLIAWSVECSRNGDGSYPDYDEACFEGGRLRAVFHTTLGRIGFVSVTRFDVNGRAETENLVTTPGEKTDPDAPDAA
jgi:hypothetical protein